MLEYVQTSFTPMIAAVSTLLLVLWVALPLLVFCVARSRMPLYLLPLFVPLAVAVARQRAAEGLGLPRWRPMAAWVVLLLALELATASWPTHKDGEAWRQAIAERVDGPVSEVLIVDDMARYSLHLEMDVHVRKLSLQPTVQPRFSPEFDGDMTEGLGKHHDPRAIWFTKQDHFAAVQSRLHELGYEAVPQGTPYERRILFRVRRQ